MPGTWAFETRDQAGRELAGVLAESYAGTEAVVLAVPRGGVPVGAPIAARLQAPLDVIVPRKIPIPWEPEAGFGAVAPDGTIVLNEQLVPLLGLSEAEILAEARLVQQEIQRRTRVYRGNRPPPATAGRLVILTDDGLASGLTMIAAVRSVRRNGPRQIVVAVPVAPRSSLERVSPEADEVICLIEQERGPFAVASFYRFFPDLSDEEVIRLLSEAHPVTGGEAPA
ncbi:MAG: phosphoribosyltransferase [Anaerolineae bacterium]|nr:phosphoribosyltransferase [Anaerolineae bacterium]